METKRHIKIKCEHCKGTGYRPDFIFIDHYGSQTKAARDCEARRKPCKDHQCYYAPKR